MLISRRSFLSILGASSLPMVAACAIPDMIGSRRRGRSSPLPLRTTPVIWLQGASCSGCSVSFLNRISTDFPVDARDVLLDIVDLRFHSTLMAAAGDSAVQMAEAVHSKASYLLIVEGAIPTTANDASAGVFTAGMGGTMQTFVMRYAANAKAVVAVGTCASFGGVATMAPNPAHAKPVSSLVSAPLVRVPGCPAHPDWLVWTLSQLLIGSTIQCDRSGRPTELFGSSIHAHCPRRRLREASALGQEDLCQRRLGCQGPSTRSGCPKTKFNNGVNWCVGTNAPCIGCVEPDFPKSRLLMT